MCGHRPIEEVPIAVNAEAVERIVASGLIAEEIWDSMPKHWRPKARVNFRRSIVIAHA